MNLICKYIPGQYIVYYLIGVKTSVRHFPTKLRGLRSVNNFYGTSKEYYLIPLFICFQFLFLSTKTLKTWHTNFDFHAVHRLTKIDKWVKKCWNHRKKVLTFPSYYLNVLNCIWNLSLFNYALHSITLNLQYFYTFMVSYVILT